MFEGVFEAYKSGLEFTRLFTYPVTTQSVAEIKRDVPLLARPLIRYYANMLGRDRETLRLIVGSDPLGIMRRYDAFVVKFPRDLNVTGKIIDRIEAANSREEILKAFDELRETARAIRTDLRQLNDLMSQIASVYFSHIRSDLSLRRDRDRLVESTIVMLSVAAALSGILAFLIFRRNQLALRRAYGEMEGKVIERTAELSTINARLEGEVEERRKTEAAYREAKEQADVANRAKSRFLANISHDLRTPLNSILGFSDMVVNEVMGPCSPAKYREYAGDIHSSGILLLELVNDLLDLEKIEAGQAKPNRQAVDVAAIMAETVDMVAEQAEKAELRISVSPLQSLPVLWGDPTMVKRIFLNLLSNAVKFTPPGGDIAISGRLDPDGGLLLQVRDTGIGIAAENTERVFEPFTRVNGDPNVAHEGTGLGLALVKSMAGLHGGTVELESELGVGTTVTVRFPETRTDGGAT